MTALRFRPELSAQRLSHQPNPAVADATRYLQALRGNRLGRVADIGCGKLRHFQLLRDLSKELVLVDTPAQLDSVHQDRSLRYTIKDYATAHSAHTIIRVRSTMEFATSNDDLDVAFCVAVFDVVPPAVRQSILRSVRRNLRRRGHFVLIIPRNDSTILERCGASNRRWDDHWFRNRDGFTFYRNFRDVAGLLRTLARGASAWSTTCLDTGRCV